MCAFIMAAEGKAIIFYRCIFYFVSIDERPAMESQPNLASRSEVVSIYKCSTKISGAFPKNLGRKNIKFWTTFPRLHTRHRISPERNVASTNKMLVSIYHVSPTKWPFSVTFDPEMTEIRLLIVTQYSAAITLQPSMLRHL